MSPPRQVPDRAEPSLKEGGRRAPRLVDPAERTDELWAGERIVVDSQPAEGEGRPPSLAWVAAIGCIILLALVGGATLVRAFVGL
jgi:hypothetical protein